MSSALTDANHASARPVTAVDCHAHVMRRDLPLVSTRHSAPQHDIDVDDYVALLDRYAISHGVLTAPSFYGPDNRLLLASLARHPDRLRGTVIVVPEVDTATLQAMDAHGVVGIRLNWFRRDVLPDVESDAYRLLFDRIRALGWQVEIYLEGPKLADLLPRVRAQGMTVVVDHFGAPDPTLGVDDRGFAEVLKGVRAGDTWVKLSAPYRMGLPRPEDAKRYADALLDAGGPQQLLWASDFPFVSFEDRIDYPMGIRWIEHFVPDDKARNVILADTPAKLFRFGPAH